MKNNHGITLIALVITIIVLLILAGISIATLTGENGVLTKADMAKKQTEIEDAKEQAKLDIATWITDKLEKGQNADVDDSIVKTILTTGNKDYIKEARDTEFTTKKNGYEIPYSELYQKGKVKFTIVAYRDSDGGSYEVESGTTWEDFFHKNFPDDWESWIYDKTTGEVLEYVYNAGEAWVEVTYLKDSNANIISKDEVIVSRKLSC